MDVDSRQLIDAQFDRAVEIVQGLPKTGPIQTGYEEKLDMYRCVLFETCRQLLCSTFHPVCTNKVKRQPIRSSSLRSDEPAQLSATVGNVQGARPNVWDMLGRAKW